MQLNDPSPPSASGAPGGRLNRVLRSQLLRQNLILFIGGFGAGVGGFVYHALAGRLLGPAVYGEVASLVSLFGIATTPALIIVLVLARDAAGVLARSELGKLPYLLTRSVRLVLIADLLVVGITAVLARPAAAFLHLGSPIPVLALGVAVAMFWQAAIPRGMLQGSHRFVELAFNQVIEMIFRTGFLYVLVIIGYAVSGALAAIFLGATAAFGTGLFSLRDFLHGRGERVRFRDMASFSLTAAVGTGGILMLYNIDVVLAKHYLDAHGAGIYGALNKLGTIVYFFTLSVSQVLFARVAAAVARNEHSGPLMLRSAAILTLLGLGALAVFAVVPRLLVNVMYSGQYDDAVPYVALMGLIGLVISLDNLLVQFFMAVPDRWFMPILVIGCVLEIVLIALFHSGPGAIVTDVLAASALLLVALTARYLVLPPIRAEMLTQGA